jgi:hypothetical protein
LREYSESWSDLNEQKKKRFHQIVSAVGLLIGGGILVYLIFYVKRNVDLNLVLAGVKPWWVLAAVLCVPAFDLIDGLLIWSMGIRSGQRVQLIGCIDSAVIGEFYYRLGPIGAPVQLKLMLDAGFTGDSAAAVYTWKATANTVVYGLFAIAALMIKLTWYQEDLGWAIIPTLILILGYAVVLGCVAFVALRPESASKLAAFLIRFFTRHLKILQKEDRGERAVRKTESFCRLFCEMRDNAPMLLRLFAGMIAQMLLIFSIPAFLYYGLGLSGIGFWNLVLTQCLVMVLTRVVMLPGNAGGAEGSFFLFMSPLFGNTVSIAMVLWRMITYVEVMAIGAIYSVFRFILRSVRRHRS